MRVNISAVCNDRLRRTLVNSVAVSSLYHLIGAGEQRWRHVQTDRLGCLQVDDELELHCPQNWQVGWLLALCTTSLAEK